MLVFWVKFLLFWNDQSTSGEVSESKQEDDECTNLTAEESAGAVTSSRISDDDKTQNPDKETQSAGKDVKKDDESETSDSQDQKNLKKPDKILPCPRCNSRDTKFCYYNNYNVNQPRHFCKNCQRYWTAGGSMRNVPVGSGRRKNKASASNFRHIMVSDALNGTVLTFGSDNRSVSESMVSVSNLVEKSQNCVSNGFHPRIPAWNTPQWRSPIQAPPLSPPGTPVALYGVFAPWNARWTSAPASPDQSTPSSTPTSPATGKHSRDGDMLKASNTGGEESLGKKGAERTLKMEDPNEAAKSFIWSTLGVKNEKVHSAGGSLFKAFKSKDDDRDRNQVAADHSLVLQANPAALSRSLNFQERT